MLVTKPNLLLPDFTGLHLIYSLAATTKTFCGDLENISFPIEFLKMSQKTKLIFCSQFVIWIFLEK